MTSRLRFAGLPFALLVACQGGVDFDPNTDGVQGGGQQEDIPPLVGRCLQGNRSVLGDVNISSRAELETLVGCDTIEGSVIIHDAEDIVDLAPLASLARISEGYFLSLNNTALTSIALPALVEIDQGFNVVNNPVLVDINVPELEEMNGDVTVRDAPVLATLAMAKLRLIQDDLDGAGVGSLILGDVPALRSLQGFAALEEIFGSLQIFNTGITNFTGLENLKVITNNLGENQNPAKLRADKLNPRIAIGIDFDSDFNIVPAGNANLQNFVGLGELNIANDFPGDIVVAFNPQLQNFEGFDDFVSLKGTFYVAGNDALQDFAGLDGDANNDGDDDGLSSLDNGLIVGVLFDRFGAPLAAGNNDLQDFSGLDNLLSVPNFIIGFCGNLQNLEGLDVLTEVDNLTLVGLEPDDLAGALVLDTINDNLSIGELRALDGSLPAGVFALVDGTPADNSVKLDTNAGDKGFDVLTIVGGDLTVAFSDVPDLQLTNPDTGTLTTIGDALILHGNSNNADLNGTQAITSIGGLVVNFFFDERGNLQPSINEGFENFNGIVATDFAARGLHIGFTDDLADFNGLPALGVVQSLTLAAAQVDQNVGPASLAGLSIVTVAGDMNLCTLTNLDSDPIDASLENLEALDFNVQTIGGNVRIAFCDELTSTNTQLGAVGGTLELSELASLDAINGFNALGSVGALALHDLDAVEDISMPGLATSLGNVLLVNNPRLVDQTYGLNQIGGSLIIDNNPDLNELDGFLNLVDVDGDVLVSDCDNITDTLGLSNLQNIGGSLTLRRLTQIANEAAAGGDQNLRFDSLQVVDGSLELIGMAGLEDLAGLDGLAIVGDTLSIADNAELTTLFGLQSLATVGRKLSIRNNPVLTLIAFDDDNLDREEDEDDNDGINNEAEDPDNILESGIANLSVIGEPLDDGGVAIGGQSGIIEIVNNPAVEQDEIDDIVGDLDENFEGFELYCGNEGTPDDESNEDRKSTQAVCGG